MDYRQAIPVLLRWLPRIEDVAVKEDIVRALSVPWARPAAAPFFVAAFPVVSDPRGLGIRWALANGLSIVADESVYDDIVRLVRNGRYGRAREMLPLALATIGDRRAIPVLIELLSDDEVAGHAVIALGKLGAEEAAGRIRLFLEHPKTWIRKEARTALERIERAKVRKSRTVARPEARP